MCRFMHMCICTQGHTCMHTGAHGLVHVGAWAGVLCVYICVRHTYELMDTCKPMDTLG
jgi:hypothetical protein